MLHNRRILKQNNYYFDKIYLFFVYMVNYAYIWSDF